jgi:hypothetical protein
LEWKTYPSHVDYTNLNDITSKVVLKLNTPKVSFYYVMINQIKLGTVVNINSSENDNTSSLVAQLRSGESKLLPNFYLGDSLEEKVNEINLNANLPYADITVELKSSKSYKPTSKPSTMRPTSNLSSKRPTLTPTSALPITSPTFITCAGECGPEYFHPCVFSFVYSGVTYNSCTTEGNNGQE